MVEPLTRPNTTNMNHNHNRIKEAQIGISVLKRLFLAQLDLLNMSINNWVISPSKGKESMPMTEYPSAQGMK